MSEEETAGSGQDIGGSPAEAARVHVTEMWHRRSIVAVAVTAVLFVGGAFIGLPKAVVVFGAVAVTAAAFWMMVTTMQVFIARADATTEEEDPEDDA